MIRRSPHIPVLPALLTLAALAFCCWNLWGSPETLCVTEGCRLFQDFKIAGVSLWLLGAIAFTLLLLLALMGLTALGYAASALGVLLDCVLLAVMVSSAPCFNCMIIGLLLALTFLAFRAALPKKNREQQRSPLFALWLLLFLLDAGIVAHSALKPWHLPALVPDAAVRIHFSPSCPACKALVEASAKESGSILWYPVAENDSDLPVIADIARRVEQGESLPEALKNARAAELPFTDYLIWQLRLWRNKAHVLDAGSQRLPFVEFSGAPEVLLKKEGHPAARQEYRASDSGTEIDASLFGVSGFCAEDEPCEGPEQRATPSLHELMNAPR